MTMKNVPWQVWAALAGVGLLLVMRSRASDVGAAVVSGVADAGAGVVLGIGDVVGIPRTNVSACDQAIADGRMWDASFACPAGRFINAGWEKYRPDFFGA